MTNRNHTPIFGLPPKQLDALFARSNEHAVADREARLQAARWPSDVEDMLVTLASEVVALRARVDAVEAAGRG